MIDVVFPVYAADGANAILQMECFASFREHTPQPHRVIVVDNGSRFGEWHARKAADVYVRLPEPVGFAKAVNLGWRLCDAEYVCVANNDLEFTAGWLPPLLAALDSGDAAIAAPVEPGVPPQPYWGACFVMRRETRERVGFLDDAHFPWRCQDQDYWIRAARLGLPFRRVPGSHVTHHESATWAKLPGHAETEARERQVMVALHGAPTAAEWAAQQATQ